MAEVAVGDILVAGTSAAGMVVGLAIMAADMAGVDPDITAVGMVTGATTTAVTIMGVTTAAIMAGAGRIMGLAGPADGAMAPTIRATTGCPVTGTGNGTLIMGDG